MNDALAQNLGLSLDAQRVLVEEGFDTAERVELITERDLAEIEGLSGDDKQRISAAVAKLKAGGTQGWHPRAVLLGCLL